MLFQQLTFTHLNLLQLFKASMSYHWNVYAYKAHVHNKIQGIVSLSAVQLDLSKVFYLTLQLNLNFSATSQQLPEILRKNMGR